MDKVYNVITKTEDYSNDARVCALLEGDHVYFVDNHDVKVGDKYKDCPAVVSRIDYKSKKSWQF